MTFMPILEPPVVLDRRVPCEDGLPHALTTQIARPWWGLGAWSILYVRCWRCGARRRA